MAKEYLTMATEDPNGKINCEGKRYSFDIRRPYKTKEKLIELFDHEKSKGNFERVLIHETRDGVNKLFKK